MLALLLGSLFVCLRRRRREVGAVRNEIDETGVEYSSPPVTPFVSHLSTSHPMSQALAIEPASLVGRPASPSAITPAALPSGAGSSSRGAPSALGRVGSVKTDGADAAQPDDPPPQYSDVHV